MNPILKNKLYLYLTEFFAGMSVMAVELGASRLLAPYFSSSQIVWTIIIGTIMIAMALGNLYGGKAADKDPDPDKLYSRILVAALWIAAIPVVGKYIIAVISGLLIFTVDSNFLVIAGFVSCMVIFVFPLFLLGTVTPSLVKYTVDSLDDSGSVVGKLNAANTIGSIIGTFVPTFVSIPAVGTAVTFLIFAGVLLALCLIYFICGILNEKNSCSASKKISGKYSTNNTQKTNKAKTGKEKTALKAVIGIIIFAACTIFGHDTSFAFWQSDLTYEGESVYNYLQVYETDKKVVLSTNVLFGTQSVYQKEKGPTGYYYDHAMAAVYMGKPDTERSQKILILGNGSGTYATQCKRYFDDLDITGVEIDDRITELAGEYFELDDSVPVETYDGRAYLNVSKEKYDVIMVDAYQDITIPFQMSSVEFFKLVAEHLTENGVMVVNLNMRSDSSGNINEYLCDTIASVFPYVYTADVQGCTNRELFAAFDDVMIEKFKVSLMNETDNDLIYMMSKVDSNLTEYDGGDRIFTDDKAAVELLGMQVIDELIKDEVSYYRDIFEREGIEGLIRLFF